MVEAKKNSQSKVKNVAFRVMKATVKAVLVYLLYFFFASLLAPIFEVVSGSMGTIETFVVIFIVLMFLGDLAEHTIFQYFLGTARSLFIIAYLVLSLGEGVVSVDFENFTLTVNLTTLYMIILLLSLLDLARSVLQAVSFMSERAERSIQL